MSKVLNIGLRHPSVNYKPITNKKEQYKNNNNIFFELTKIDLRFIGVDMAAAVICAFIHKSVYNQFERRVYHEDFLELQDKIHELMDDYKNRIYYPVKIGPLFPENVDDKGLFTNERINIDRDFLKETINVFAYYRAFLQDPIFDIDFFEESSTKSDKTINARLTGLYVKDQLSVTLLDTINAPQINFFTDEKY